MLARGGGIGQGDSQTICRLPSLSVERLVLCELSVESLRSESLSGVAAILFCSSSLSLSLSSSLEAAAVPLSTAGGAVEAELEELSELLAAAAVYVVCGQRQRCNKHTDTVRQHKR